MYSENLGFLTFPTGALFSTKMVHYFLYNLVTYVKAAKIRQKKFNPQNHLVPMSDETENELSKKKKKRGREAEIRIFSFSHFGG